MKFVLKKIWKWLFTGLVLFLVYRFGLFEGLSDLKKLLEHPWILFFSFLLVLMAYLVSFWRWHRLAQELKIAFSFKDSLVMNMSGQFLAFIAPGTTGADALKILYTAKEYPEKKSRGILSVLMDRVLGLLGICFLSVLLAIPNIIYWSHFSQSGQLSFLFYFSLLGSLLFLLSLVFPFEKIKVPQFLRDFKEAFVQLKKQPQVLFEGIFYSALNHFLNSASMYIVLKTLYGEAFISEISFFDFCFIVNTASILMGIPLTPMALGVGQVGFVYLFREYGMLNTGVAVNSISSYQAFSLVISMLGAFFLPYLKWRKKT